MSPAESFQRRVRALVEAAGGKKPLARKLGVTDSAINSWLAGSHPFESKLQAACERSGVALAWLRDGKGRAEDELAKVAEGNRHRRTAFNDANQHALGVRVMEDAPPILIDTGWRVVVRVLADRLTSTQIAEALNEILAQSNIDEAVRNGASQILIAAQLPKLKR